jgi:hypothetical protein
LEGVRARWKTRKRRKEKERDGKRRKEKEREGKKRKEKKREKHLSHA